ncbi:hypothetical protein [Nocardiopsis algeriensis]|uniref:Uncharacterized protein n=1 Tax=Nocardiopsis algeriensis TaxID=1478215 RepID=A0A841ISF8_9ACTN|nr:hypothetical protein [Nocardiopsis algeriensis]MBB6121062.1 hypothetical protein [Nocardiopsis algeriensis]
MTSGAGPEPDQAFVDFLRKVHSEHRWEKERKPLRWWAFSLMVLLCLPPVLLLGLCLAFGVETVLKAVLFAQDGRQAEAAVLWVRNGRPMVEFVAHDGQSLVAWAEGRHRHDPAHTVDVLYLSGAPGAAVVAGHRWNFWPLLPVALAPVLTWWWACHHRAGFRAGWFVRRARVHVQGLPGRPRPVAPLLVFAVFAGTSAVAVLGGSVLALTLLSPAEVLEKQLSFLLIPVPVLLAAALLALVRAAYRYAEDHPVRRLPRPFPLLPKRSIRFLAALVAAVVLVSVPVFWREPLSDPVAGTAELLETRFSGGSHRNWAYLDIGYEVDGLYFEDTVEVSRSTAEELGVRGTVPVVWEASDPVDVRLREDG